MKFFIKLKFLLTFIYQAVLGTGHFPRSEYFTLKDLYHFTSGPNWLFKTNSWNFSNLNNNPCQWYGVTCECFDPEPDSANKENILNSYYGAPVYQYWYDDMLKIPRNSCHVTRLNLMGMNLTGSIPASIGNLTHLTHVKIKLR